MRPRLFYESAQDGRPSGVLCAPFRPRSVAGFFSFLIAAIAAAQDPAILSNHGEPIRVPYACPEEDLQFAGMSCNDDQPCAVYLELSAVAATGGRILVAGDVHGTSATLASILLLSDDSGATWKEPAARIRGAALDQLEWFDAKTAWAAGETQYPLARGAFFLLTTDGGSSWRHQAIADDDSPGSLLHFGFDSAKHGEAIVDAGTAAAGGRYFSYESETGGESWSLEGQSDVLPKLRHAPPVDQNPAWRLVASKDGKAFQVERDKVTVASFLIDVAKCGNPRGEAR